MIVLFDTCIILDYLMCRKPFAEDSKELVKNVTNNRIEGLVTVKSMMDIHYVVKNHLHDESKTRNILMNISSIFEIIDSLSYSYFKALDSKINDFEDAMMSQAGEVINVDYFVTRNIKDYKNSKLKVVTPKELIEIIKNSKY